MVKFIRWKFHYFWTLSVAFKNTDCPKRGNRRRQRTLRTMMRVTLTTLYTGKILVK